MAQLSRAYAVMLFLLTCVVASYAALAVGPLAGP